jgi:polar amino acid transport system ATP-binding protein
MDEAVVLRSENVHKRYDDLEVLRGVSFEVGRGQVKVIIGPSGSGKSTLLRCLALLEKPDSGDVYLEGESLAGLREKELAPHRSEVGMVFQRFNLFPHLTAVENIMLAPVLAGTPESEALQRAVALLKRVGLSHRGLAYPDQMSGGEQQRVAIARALALKPTVLLFDEPTSSLDPEATSEVLRVMRELADDGMTMVLVTHEIAFARDVADQVVFVDGGLIVEQGAPADVLGNPRQQRTRAFLTSFGVPGS